MANAESRHNDGKAHDGAMGFLTATIPVAIMTMMAVLWINDVSYENLAATTLDDPGWHQIGAEPLAVMPAQTSKLLEQVSVKVELNDLQAFSNILGTDIVQHGGVHVSTHLNKRTQGTHVYLVKQSYLPRLLPLVEASRSDQHGDAYTEWANAPPSVHIVDQPADVEVTFHIASNSEYKRTLWYWPAIAGTVVVALFVWVFMIWVFTRPI